MLGVALLTLAACGSSQPRILAVQVFEARPQGHAPNFVSTAEGQHVFRVRVTNQSGASVYIDSISIESFSSEMQFRNSDLAVNQTLEPGETQDFAVSVDVTLVPKSHIYVIDSVDVAIACRTSEGKSFTEKANYSVKPE